MKTEGRDEQAEARPHEGGPLMAKKKKGHGGHESSERWLLTYADMITLLTAFFIMMYSMSVLNVTKFQQVAIAIRSGFGGPLDTAGHGILQPSVGQASRPTLIPEINQFRPDLVADQIKKYAKKKGLEKELHLRQTERGLVVSIVTDKMLFPAGAAALTPGAVQVLDKVSSLIKSTNSIIRVEGHTDNMPIHTLQFPSNWELSTARATTVVRQLVDREGIPSSRLSAAGYADGHPLAPNTTPANRAANRRVDIVILKGDSPTVPPKPSGRLVAQAQRGSPSSLATD